MSNRCYPIVLLYLILPVSLMAQRMDISGVVRDTRDHPIEGANVMVKDSNRGQANGVNRAGTW